MKFIKRTYNGKPCQDILIIPNMSWTKNTIEIKINPIINPSIISFFILEWKANPIVLNGFLSINFVIRKEPNITTIKSGDELMNKNNLWSSKIIFFGMNFNISIIGINKITKINIKREILQTGLNWLLVKKRFFRFID